MTKLSKNQIHVIIGIIILLVLITGQPKQYKKLGASTNINLHYPVYSTSTVRIYYMDGGMEEITSEQDVVAFLNNKLDIAIGGKVGSSVLSTPILLAYESMETAHINTDFYPMIADKESYFAHIPGEPETFDTRLTKRRVLENTYLINHNSDFKVDHGNYIAGKVTGNYNGVFLDNTLHSVSGINYAGKKEELRDLTTITTMEIPEVTLHTPGPYGFPPNPIIVSGNSDFSGHNYYLDNDEHLINLNQDYTLSQAYCRYYYIQDPELPDYEEEVKSSIQYYKSTLFPSNPIIINSDTTIREHLLSGWSFLDGAMDEFFIYAPGTSCSYQTSIGSWQADVDLLSQVSNSQMYLTVSGANSCSDEDTRQRAMFTYTSFLLGAGSKGYYAFGLDDSYSSTYPYFEYYDISIGSAQENYYENSETTLYERIYSNALIMVNPTATEYDLDLPQSYNYIINPQGIREPIPLTIHLPGYSSLILYDGSGGGQPGGGGGGGGGARMKECHFIENSTCYIEEVREWEDCPQYNTSAECQSALPQPDKQSPIWLYIMLAGIMFYIIFRRK